jgi:hypothetical protein
MVFLFLAQKKIYLGNAACSFLEDIENYNFVNIERFRYV